MDRPPPGRRADYRAFHAITTRWMDNDVYGHVNNAHFLSYFDTAVSGFEVAHRLVELGGEGPICLVVETQCRYHRPVAFPDRLAVGLRCARIGTSSVRFEIGVFRNDDDAAAAEGHLVHVFVQRATLHPVPVPAAARAVLETILART